jgi:hypothetical protein
MKTRLRPQAIAMLAASKKGESNNKRSQATLPLVR